MTSADGKNIVLEGWKSAGITEIIQKDLNNFPGLDSFSDIDPMINLDTVEPNLEAVIDKTTKDLEMLRVKTINDDDTDDDHDEIVYKIHSNAFDIFDDDFIEQTGYM